MECAVVKAILFGNFDEPTAMAWAANGNLVAVGLPSKGELTARVVVLEPDALHEHVVLEVPMKAAGDCIVAVSFSPVHAPLTLLTATKRGNIILWMPRQSEQNFQPLAVNTWSSQKIELECEEWVVVKFLSAPSSFRWPPHDLIYSSGQPAAIPLERRFLTMDHIVTGDPAWLRTGILHFIALDASGSFYVAWKTLEGWTVTKRQKLPGVNGRLVCADVIGGRGSTLRVAVVTVENQMMATVMNVKGHPRSSEDDVTSFTIGTVCTIQTSVKHPISDVKFRPEALGDCVVVLQKSCDCIAVTKHAVSVDDPATFNEQRRAIINTETMEPQVVDTVSLALSPDGGCMALCVPGSSPSLISMSTLSIIDRLNGDEASKSVSGVFSPNGICFAEIQKMQLRFKLQFWSLSEKSTGTTGRFDDPRALEMWDSMRLTWSMLSNSDSWDICQRIQHTAAAVPETFTYFSLFYVDRMLHRHPHTSRPQYADLLDKIKIRILRNTEDPTVQAVLVDLYARRMISYHLFRGFASTFLSSSQCCYQSLSTDEWSEPDKASCVRWIQWTEEVFRFLCRSVKTWIVRSATSSDNTASMAPFVRLLGDTHFVKNLSILLYCFSLVTNVVFPPPFANEKHQRFQEYCDTVNQMHTIVKKANTFTAVKDPESFEGIEAFRSLAQKTRKTICGQVHLHYSRLDGPITREVMQTMGRIKLVKEATPLEQSEIAAKAVELGLLPDRALKGYLFLKEKERQNHDPLSHPKQNKGKLPLFDCLRARTLNEGQSLFFAVDQTCIADFNATSQEPGMGISRLDTTLLKQSAARSPFTGSLWKRLL